MAIFLFRWSDCSLIREGKQDGRFGEYQNSIGRTANTLVLATESLPDLGSKPWPEWPLVWVAPGADISKAVLDLYNASSGEPAPTTTPRPSGTTNPTPETKHK